MSNAADIRASAVRKADKRKRELVTPEGVALPLTIASRGSRAGAIIIDLMILGTASIALTIALLFIAFGTLSGPNDGELAGATEFLFILWSLTWFIAWSGYFMFFEMGPRGATLGKRLVGIRVAARDGGRLTPEAVIARNLLRDIELFLPLVLIAGAPDGQGGAAGWAALGWFVIFLLFPFFNKDAMRAGDLVAGTWVLDAPKPELAANLSTGGTAATHVSDVTGTKYQFGDEELSIYGEYELQTLERILRDGRPDALKTVAETICAKIGWTPGTGDERAFLEAFYAQLRKRLESDMRFGKRKADKFAE
ncbi:MAG: RDD family protein [Pontixanthobacter sp.]